MVAWLPRREPTASRLSLPRSADTVDSRSGALASYLIAKLSTLLSTSVPSLRNELDVR
jgi:hypothetical protein